MKINKLEINNFKSISEMNFDAFKPGLNIFIGKNNSGKSNILEALNIIFNRDTIKINEVSKFLPFQKGSELSDVNMNINFHSEESKAIKINFDSNNKEKKMTRGSTIVKGSGLPSLVYLSNSNNITEMSESILKLYPKEDEEYSAFLTNSNQFLGDIFDSSYKVYIDNRGTENPKIRLIDEFGDDDIIDNKSSGTQLASLTAMLLSIGLNSKSKNGFIIAIDEPENSLHIGSQKKYFALLKELAKKHQVIIATHSVIFIDKAQDENTYLVERDRIGRTNYHLKKHKTENWKLLREIIGISLSDSLLLGEFNVIVEGRTEQILFPKMIDILEKNMEIKVSAQRYNFISAEGSAKMEPFLSILKDKIELPMVIFLDNDNAGRTTLKKIDNKEKYNRDLIIVPEIEDFITEEILFKCINNYFNERLKGFKEFEVEKLRELRGTKKFNNFKKEIERLVQETYPEADEEINKTVLALFLKQELEKPIHFEKLISEFKKVDNYFKNF
jgi:predicted ATP-dependent endonuclease of OLD family